MKSYEEILSQMTNRYQELTGVSPNDASDIGIRMKVLSAVCSELFANIEQLKQDLFPQTASGSFLELHAQTRALSRKEASRATGMLYFYRETPALAEISVPKGTICAIAGEDNLRYETTESATVSVGKTGVLVPAQAQQGGQKYNCKAGVITMMVTPPAGISMVKNTTMMQGGTDIEDDDSLRDRLFHTYRQISNGTNTAFYRNEAMKYPEVHSVNVIPRYSGRGSVGIVLATKDGSAVSTQTINQLKAQLGQQREIGVDVTVLAAQCSAINLNMNVDCMEAYDPQTICKYYGRVLCKKIQETKGVGQGLYLSDLYGCIGNAPEIRSYTFMGFTDCAADSQKIYRISSIHFTAGSLTFTQTYEGEIV